ncbi:MAG: hypothetical protein CFH41_01429 [Alphaproteobacteria bacterium MarineAlpha11_Bin1]|nr:MAG: hypothetical protein CFH41_01429 [Alphaproteobacteria bacterium MarineAlpha11_Bin1]
MRLIMGIIVFVPCSVLLSVFAVENRQTLKLELWPIAGEIELSASLWLLITLALGVMAGLGIGWISTVNWCRRARKAERHNRTLERKLDERDHPPKAVSTSQKLSDGTMQASGTRTQSSRAVLIED